MRNLTCIHMEDLKGKYIRWSEECVWQLFGTTLTIIKTLESSFTGDKSSCVRLNETGRDIWDLCDGTKTFDVIVDQLLQEYKGESEKIRENVEKTISTLKEQGFLTYEEALKKYDMPEILSEKVLPQKYPIWDDNVIWDEVEGHIVAMNNQTGLIFEVPDEAEDMWKLCDGKKKVDEILSILKEKGTINEEMPAFMFNLLFKRFIKLGLLSLRDEPT